MAVAPRSRTCPRPPRELAAGADRPADGVGDLVERHGEHVVQHERDPLRRAQPPQHLQQRGTDLVVEGDAVGGVGRAGRRRRIGRSVGVTHVGTRAERS